MSERQLPAPEPDEQPEVEATHEGNPDVIPESPVAEDRNSRGLAADADLNPMSLVGRWFHRIENGTMVWAGIVVGEPQPGKYLIELDRCAEGAKGRSVQVLADLDSMLAKDEGYEYRFYDTESQMQDAYAEYLVAQEVGA